MGKCASRHLYSYGGLFNLVPRAFSLAWDQLPSQGKGPGNEVEDCLDLRGILVYDICLISVSNPVSDGTTNN